MNLMLCPFKRAQHRKKHCIFLHFCSIYKANSCMKRKRRLLSGHVGQGSRTHRSKNKNSNLHLCIISRDLKSNTVTIDDVNISLRCWTDNSVYKLLALAACGLEFNLQQHVKSEQKQYVPAATVMGRASDRRIPGAW